MSGQFLFTTSSDLGSPAPPPSPAPPIICTDPGAKAADLGENIGMAVANIFGIGGLVEGLGGQTGLDKLKSQVSTLNQEIQDFSNNASEAFAKIQAHFDNDVVSALSTMRGNTKALMDFNTEILQDEITSNKIYIASTFIFTLLLFGYLLITPNPKS
jgi:hypothetical protein